MFFRWCGVIYTNDFLDSIDFQIHFGTFLTLFYILYYLSLGEYEVTGSGSVLQLILLAIGTKVANKNMDSVPMWFLASQIILWSGQVVVGHKIIEKRSPTLLDSAFDAFIMAPLFVWWETLFFFGYGKEFQAELEVEVKRKIAILNKGGSIKPKRGFD